MEYYNKLKQAEYDFFNNMYLDLDEYTKNKKHINRENIQDYLIKKYNCFYDFEKDYYQIFETLEMFIINKIINICKTCTDKSLYSLREAVYNSISQKILYNYLLFNSLKRIDKELGYKSGNMICKKYNYPKEYDIINYNGYDGISLNVGIFTFSITFP